MKKRVVKSPSLKSQSDPSLKTLQHWLRWVITDTRGVDATLDGACVSEPTPRCLNSIVQAPPLARERRLDIYAEAYFSRLCDNLAEDFRAVQHLVGEGVFQRIVLEYLQAHPPQSFDASRVGQYLPVFLKTYFLGKEIMALPDLARLEWVCVESFHAKDEKPFDLGSCRNFSESAWAAARFQLGASVHFILSDWNIDDLWSGRSNQVESSERHLIVFRHNYNVHVQAIDELKALVLNLLGQGLSLSNVCERLESELAEEAGLPPVMQWFEEWVRVGIISSIY